MNVLLVSPRTPTTFWSYRHALRFVSRRSAHPPLGLLTVAALLPREWSYRVIDLDVRRLRPADIRWADYVLVSAMIIHARSVHEIAALCAAEGRPLIAGGPLFTTGHQAFPEIPHFVLGEAEELANELADDMRAGRVRRVYEAAGFPDITRTPAPRWDLIDFRHYASMSIQFSRGCPYDCEFCDIIVMNGRVPRTKTPDQVITELEGLRERGWDAPVFLVDDNFIGNKQRVKALLRRMIEWRRETGTRMDFTTEASVNLADDPELLALMVEAGFNKVFLGIETPALEGLQECRKQQNTRTDLMEAVRTIQRAGMEVMGGFIVGFDSDTPDIFQRQFEFIQKAGVVTAMVGILTALPKTRLYKRLKAEGRLLGDSSGDNTEGSCNFIPKLNREQLIGGYHRLMRRLYEPGNYYRRIAAFLAQYRERQPRVRIGPIEIRAFVRSLWLLGVCHRGRRAYWAFLTRTLVRHPRAFGLAMTLAIHGYHFRRVANML